MTRTPAQMWQQFRQYWKHFILQSVFATVVIFLVFLTLGTQETVIIASLGATTFIIFALPKKFTAQPRNVIGGHATGLLCGFIGSWIVSLMPEQGNDLLWIHLVQAAGYALAVGLAIFIMVVIDTEHPPAAGTALGIAVDGFTWQVAGFVIIVSILLSAIRYLFRNQLRDLT
ncbi:MAG: HPP family protein [Sedimentisphaerales bacterium]|nr:HPP family protein [Sedimentisphaerales bacterium]